MKTVILSLGLVLTSTLVLGQGLQIPDGFGGGDYSNQQQQQQQEPNYFSGSYNYQMPKLKLELPKMKATQKKTCITTKVYGTYYTSCY